MGTRVRLLGSESYLYHFTGQVTLERSLNSSVVQFPHLQNGLNNYYLPQRVVVKLK